MFYAISRNWMAQYNLLVQLVLVQLSFGRVVFWSSRCLVQLSFFILMWSSCRLVELSYIPLTFVTLLNGLSPLIPSYIPLWSSHPFVKEQDWNSLSVIIHEGIQLLHLKENQYLTLKGNSVTHTHQFNVSHDPIEPLKGYSVSHT
jgi:hypothetical protein